MIASDAGSAKLELTVVSVVAVVDSSCHAGGYLTVGCETLGVVVGWGDSPEDWLRTSILAVDIDL